MSEPTIWSIGLRTDRLRQGDDATRGLAHAWDGKLVGRVRVYGLKNEG